MHHSKFVLQIMSKFLKLCFSPINPLNHGGEKSLILKILNLENSDTESEILGNKSGNYIAISNND